MPLIYPLLAPAPESPPLMWPLMGHVCQWDIEWWVHRLPRRVADGGRLIAQPWLLICSNSAVNIAFASTAFVFATGFLARA